MKHLKQNKLGYWQHWFFAMKLSLALFVHAWYPDVLETYVSDQICKNEKSRDEQLETLPTLHIHIRWTSRWTPNGKNALQTHLFLIVLHRGGMLDVSLDV